jgi:hypothetical protein
MFLSFFEPMAALAKIVLPFLVIGILLTTYQLIDTGRLMAQEGPSKSIVDVHKILLLTIAVMLLIVIAFVEALVQTANPSVARSPLFWWIHLPMVVLFIATTGLAIRYNGMSVHKKWHKYFVYPALVCLLIIAGTGLWLVFQ